MEHQSPAKERYFIVHFTKARKWPQMCMVFISISTQRHISNDFLMLWYAWCYVIDSWTKTTELLNFLLWMNAVFLLFLTFQNKMVWCFFNKNTKIRVIKRHVMHLSLETTEICHHLLQSTEKVVNICNNILWSFTNMLPSQVILQWFSYVSCVLT